jgi:membrane associated rhomboid family serine protease
MNFNALPLVTKRLIIINALVFLFTEFLRFAALSPFSFLNRSFSDRSNSSRTCSPMEE